MFAASKTDSVSGAAPDGQFNYVTMLLHGDGTNGGQNNTFLDSSTNNFTITRNGNTTQGSFSPYGSNWSNFFDGTGDYLSIADNAALDMGSSSFTIEGWILLPANVSAGRGVFGKRANNGVVGGILFYFSDTGVTPRLLADIGGSWGVDITASSGFTLGQWNHFAIVRNSNTWTIYINGTSVGSATNSGTVVDSSAAFTIMAESAAASEGTTLGYISNFRVVKGSAVYTSAFTPSTTPLTTITNTSLLTCQSNRFVDNSANNFTITRNGDTSVQRFNPFGTSTAYSTSVIGGSGYFDGSGDYLTISTTSAFGFGTGSLTAECWIYPTVLGSITRDILEFRQSNTTQPFAIQINSSNTVFVYNGSAQSSTGTVILNTWNHIAFVRNGSSCNLYLNGVSVSSFTDSSDYRSTNPLSIGTNQFSTSEIFQGYISDVRVVKGTAVYTSTFTPPTAPLSAITNTSLLTKFTNGAIFDNAMMNDLETVGNAQISTSVKKYGTGSLAFDGTGDWLTAPSNPNFIFNGNFTIECWFYPRTLTGNQGIFASSGERFGLIRVGSSIYWLGTPDVAGTSGTLTNNTWQHIAVSRSSGTLRLFVNGVLDVSGTTTQVNSQFPWYVGANQDLEALNGYIDDLRITKGYARYTATFTPPTSALSDTGPY